MWIYGLVVFSVLYLIHWNCLFMFWKHPNSQLQVLHDWYMYIVLVLPLHHSSLCLCFCYCHVIWIYYLCYFFVVLKLKMSKPLSEGHPVKCTIPKDKVCIFVKLFNSKHGFWSESSTITVGRMIQISNLLFYHSTQKVVGLTVCQKTQLLCAACTHGVYLIDMAVRIITYSCVTTYQLSMTIPLLFISQSALLINIFTITTLKFCFVSFDA